MKFSTRFMALALAFVFTIGFAQAQNKVGTSAIPGDNSNTESTYKSANSTRGILLEEGFDIAGDFPPGDWTWEQLNPDASWIQANPADPTPTFGTIDPENVWSAMVAHEPNNDQDEWLISPEITATETPVVLDCYVGTNSGWLEFATIKIQITTDDGANWTELWDAVELGDITDWDWNRVILDLDAYVDMPFKIAFQYVGVGGNLAGIDGVMVKSGLDYLYQSDLEDYTAGEYVAESDETGFWTTWDDAPGTSTDGLIVDVEAASPVNAGQVEGETDLLFLMGDKKTGKYQFNFKIFVPTGSGGYYNLQHFEEPGTEWAYDVFFSSMEGDGNAWIFAGAPDSIPFNYTNNEWVLVENIIDLDNDWAEFWIDGMLVHEFVFSNQAYEEGGTLQLGGADFWAGAPDGDTPLYYFDDVEFIELVAGLQEPILEVTGNFPIFVALEQWQEATENFNMGNAGEADLMYDMTVTYPEGVTAKKAVAKKAPSHNHNFSKEVAADPNPIAFRPQTSREEVLTYASDNTEAGAIGNPNGDYDWRVMAKFPADMVYDYIGMDITQVSVFLNDPPLSTKIQIYGMGVLGGESAGELLLEQDFQGIGGEWNDIELDTPLHIDGQDLWVGYQVNGLGGTFVCATDEGPAHTDGQWISFGGGWTRLVDANPDLTGNWHIRAYVNGWTTPHWLSVSPMSGTLTQDEYIDVDVNINTANLEADPQYGKIILRSNDSENDWVNVEVYVDVSVGLNEFGEKEYVAVYPNPAKDVLRVKSNGDLQNVRLMNSVGQVVFNQVINSSDMQINISSYDAGVYFIQIETGVGTTTQKIIIE